GHCHALLAAGPDPAGFALAATEADVPWPDALAPLDGPVGLAIRRWCGPVLGLPVGASFDDYLARRADVGRGAKAEVRKVVRLERVAERLTADGVSAAGFAAAYADALAAATVDAVAVKSVLAYRGGFSAEAGRPSRTEVRTAAGRWLARTAPRAGAAGAPTAPPRLDEPVLLRFALWCGVDRGLPVQIHTGFGDRDLRLAAADPALLQPFLAGAERRAVPIVLLHCYPYHRQA